MKSLVSIIVPVYRVEKYLPQCVESILSQSYDNIELYLVDDGSPDNCPNMCDAYTLRDSRVRVIHTPNRGVSSARNTALELASGDYILFVDSDDWIDKDMVKKMLEQAVISHADICVCRFAYVHSDDIVVAGHLSDSVSYYGRNEFLERILMDNTCGGYACNKLIRHEILGDTRFNEKLHVCEDTLFYVQLAIKCSRVVQMRAELYYYRLKPAESLISYSDNRFSLIHAHELIISICKKEAPHLIPYLNVRYLHHNLNMKACMKNAHVKNNEYMAILNDNIRRTILPVMRDINISLYEKFMIICTWLMPETMLKIRHAKRKILKTI